MRRLIASLYERLFGLHITTAAQQIEDMNNMLNDLLIVRETIQTEINQARSQLAKAQRRLEAIRNKIK